MAMRRSLARLSTQSAAPHVVGVGLGNMGAPLTGRIAAKFPTAVYDLNAATVAKHSEQWGSTVIDGVETLHTLTTTADVIVTCLPNTNLTRVTLDTLRPALREGTVWLDATSGRGEDAAALADELLEGYGVRYLDCAVSGGPRGAEKGILAALVGGDKPTFERVVDVRRCFCFDLNLSPRRISDAHVLQRHSLLSLYRSIAVRSSQ